MVIAYSLKKAIMWLWIASSSGVATLKASEETCAQIFDDEESFGSETSSSQEKQPHSSCGTWWKAHSLVPSSLAPNKSACTRVFQSITILVEKC